MKNLSKLKQHRKYFDNIGKRYSEEILPMIFSLKLLRKATENYVKGEVLVIGSGGLINFDTRNVEHIVLTDVTLKTMENPQVIVGDGFKPVDKHLKKIITVFQANALKLPFSVNSFDTVIMFNVAHHLSALSRVISKRNVDKSISEIYRVLRKNGKLLLCEACPTTIPKIIQDTAYDLFSPLFLKYGKPIPYFLSSTQICDLLNKYKFNLTINKKIPLIGRVYQPVFPQFSPPGWLWELILPNRLYISSK